MRRTDGLAIRASRQMARVSRLWTIPKQGDDGGAVAVVDLAGKKKMLSEGWDSVQGLAWSPDANEIWFTATRTGGDRSLYATDLSGKVRLLARVPGELTILDVGKEGNVLLTRGNDRAGMIGLAPGEAKEKDLSWLDWSVPGSLSADGKMILFQESGEGGGPHYAVYLRNTDGSPAIRLGEGTGVSLSPDGQWALSRLNVVPSPLVLYPTGVGEMKQLKNDGLNHMSGFSARRKEICIHRYRAWTRRAPVSWSRSKRAKLSHQHGGSAVEHLVSRRQFVAARGPDRKTYCSRLRGRAEAGCGSAAGGISDIVVVGWTFAICDHARPNSGAGVSCGRGDGTKNLLAVVRACGFGGDRYHPGRFSFHRQQDLRLWI